MQRLMAATAISLLLAASAAAQTTTQPAPASPTTQMQYYQATTDDQRASKLIGTTVRNSAGESIGEINDIVLGKDGKVAAVVIGVGGFLGIGEREIAVSFASLQLARDSSGRAAATLPNATKDSLKAAPEWKWANKS